MEKLKVDITTIKTKIKTKLTKRDIIILNNKINDILRFINDYIYTKVKTNEELTYLEQNKDDLLILIENNMNILNSINEETSLESSIKEDFRHTLTNYISYPDYQHANFNQIIYNKKEFRENKIESLQPTNNVSPGVLKRRLKQIKKFVNMMKQMNMI